MTTISRSQAVQLIGENVKGATFITIDAETDPRMTKTGNPYKDAGIIKACTMNGSIGFDYPKSVNRLADKEGKDARQSKPRKWGVLTPDRLFVTHKGEFYLQMKVEHASTPVYRDKLGNVVEKAELEAFLPKRKKSSTQADLDGEVVVRDVKMSNIRRMRFMGNEYEVVAHEVLEASEIV